MSELIRSTLWDNGGDDRSCQHCGEDNATWFTDDWVWNAATGGDEYSETFGVLCPLCFMKCARDLGIVAWRVIPEWSGRAKGLPQ